jgi:hypothetical protein
VVVSQKFNVKTEGDTANLSSRTKFELTVLDRLQAIHLIGVDPDFRIHVSDRLLEIHDGPFLELGLTGIAGTLIDRPRRLEDRRDRDRLALRFEEFKKAA